MSDVDISRLRKLYDHAKNKNREYVEPIDENIVQKALKIIEQKLENASGRLDYIRITFDGMIVPDKEMLKVSSILNEQNIKHIIHRHFLRGWIQIQL